MEQNGLKLWGSGAFFLPPQGMYYPVSYTLFLLEILLLIILFLNGLLNFFFFLLNLYTSPCRRDKRWVENPREASLAQLNRLYRPCSASILVIFSPPLCSTLFLFRLCVESPFLELNRVWMVCVFRQAFFSTPK